MPSVKMIDSSEYFFLPLLEKLDISEIVNLLKLLEDELEIVRKEKNTQEAVLLSSQIKYVSQLLHEKVKEEEEERVLESMREKDRIDELEEMLME